MADDLPRELRDLSAWLETPQAPDVTGTVRARLAQAPTQISRRRSWPRRWRLAAVAVTVLLMALLPPGRAAIAYAIDGLIRFAGVTIGRSPDRVAPSRSVSALPSQRSAALAEAARGVRFAVRVPAALGDPEQILLADPDPDGKHRVLSLIYRGGAVRLDAFDGELEPTFSKRVFGSGANPTQVDGRYAIWIPGPHELTYVDRDGAVRTGTARLAAPTLIWERNGVSYRLEGVLSEADAVRIAESLR